MVYDAPGAREVAYAWGLVRDSVPEPKCVEWWHRKSDGRHRVSFNLGAAVVTWHEGGTPKVRLRRVTRPGVT